MKIIITFHHGNTMVKIKTEINSVLIISLIKNFFLFINFVIFITIHQKRINYFINHLKLKELPIITSFEEEGKVKGILCRTDVLRFLHLRSELGV